MHLKLTDHPWKVSYIFLFLFPLKSFDFILCRRVREAEIEKKFEIRRERERMIQRQ